MTGQVMNRMLYPLPSGTEVGPWRLVHHRGGGFNGLVYRAEPMGRAGQEPVALKLATLPGDERFEREVALLSLVRHPNVPRLRDSGVWTLPNGVSLPYLVMDWIDGVSLYEWAMQQPRTSRQVLRVLAQLARALEAMHRAGCMHRDVKGDNVLVTAEGRAFLMDFGSGKFKGARLLTHELLAPGTAQYRSPQAQRFQWAYRLQTGISYEHTEADDVYALGVAAYRVVTGLYPPSGFDLARAVDPAQPPQPSRQPPKKLATVSPELNALILRMLSEAPENRGSIGEVAQALEQAAEQANSKADVPIIRRPRRPASGRSVRQGLQSTLGFAAAVGGTVLALCTVWVVLSREQRAPVAQPMREADKGDHGAVALGDSASQAPEATTMRPVASTGLGLEMPRRPFNGQLVPPCQGLEVEIELTPGQKDTRSCWIEVKATPEKCKTKGYEYRGGCYLPTYPSPKVPQSIGP
jgi:predicted Ser/Thr protein kinase